MTWLLRMTCVLCVLGCRPQDAGTGATDAAVSHIPDASAHLLDASAPADAHVLDPDASIPDATVTPDASMVPDAAVPDAAVAPDASVSTVHDPILFIHGINGSAADWDIMLERFVADGWPRERLMARTFANPSWGCNEDNAVTIGQWATELMQTTGAARIDMVAHSMGTLSSRHYVKDLGGAVFVNTYVTVAGMNHGLTSPCFSPLNVCVWKELCATGPYVTALNAAPATPPPVTWVAIYSDTDQTVPVMSAPLDGAENILIPNLMHDGPMGVQNSELVYAEVKRVLLYPGH